MTSTNMPNDFDFYSEKSFLTEDNYDRETIGIINFLIK